MDGSKPPAAEAIARSDDRWVVCGVSDSTASQTATRVAGLLSSVVGRPLALAHVRDTRDPISSATLALQQAEVALEAIGRSANGMVMAEQRLLHGRPETGLLAESGRPSTHLMVVGAPRRGRLCTALRGGGVSHITANSRCPVLVVPEQLGFREDWLARAPEIVVAVDGSHESWRAALVAARVARESGGSLLLTHALHESEVTGFHSTSQTSKWHRNAVETERAARLAALETVEPELAAIAPTRTVLLDGDPRSAIPLLVDEARARLVAVGSRGRGGRAAAILGSVSMAIATTVAVPTLITGRHTVSDEERRQADRRALPIDGWALPPELTPDGERDR
jgi:nucleotide-binding universal stress UspA family protein